MMDDDVSSLDGVFDFILLPGVAGGGLTLRTATPGALIYIYNIIYIHTYVPT